MSFSSIYDDFCKTAESLLQIMQMEEQYLRDTRLTQLDSLLQKKSELFKSNVDGVIDRVHTGIHNSEGYEMYNMRIRSERIPMIGDKMCFSPDHEILTTDGWINIADLTLNHKIACLKEGNILTYDNNYILIGTFTKSIIIKNDTLNANDEWRTLIIKMDENKISNKIQHRS